MILTDWPQSLGIMYRKSAETVRDMNTLLQVYMLELSSREGDESSVFVNKHMHV